MAENISFVKVKVLFVLFASLIFLPKSSQHAYAQDDPASKALLLFGGEDHKTFLGCLNCSDKSAVSICNEYDQYGSPYRTDSIWNEYGTYGSKYRQDSPWNKYGRNAPIIVDKDGTSYGYFSANAYHPDRTKVKWLVKILDAEAKEDDLKVAHAMLCADE